MFNHVAALEQSIVRVHLDGFVPMTLERLGIGVENSEEASIACGNLLVERLILELRIAPVMLPQEGRIVGVYDQDAQGRFSRTLECRRSGRFRPEAGSGSTAGLLP